jgi:hypothetical protein
VGKEEVLDLVRGDGKFFPVPVGIVPLLKQTTIDENLQSADVQKVA